MKKQRKEFIDSLMKAGFSKTVSESIEDIRTVIFEADFEKDFEERMNKNYEYMVNSGKNFEIYDDKTYEKFMNNPDEHKNFVDGRPGTHDMTYIGDKMDDSIADYTVRFSSKVTRPYPRRPREPENKDDAIAMERYNKEYSEYKIASDAYKKDRRDVCDRIKEAADSVYPELGFKMHIGQYPGNPDEMCVRGEIKYVLAFVNSLYADDKDRLNDEKHLYRAGYSYSSDEWDDDLDEEHVYAVDISPSIGEKESEILELGGMFNHIQVPRNELDRYVMPERDEKLKKALEDAGVPGGKLI